MKRLLVLALLSVLAVSSAGCRWGSWNRGAPCNPCAAPTAGYGEAYLAPPGGVTPTYDPGPG